MTKGRRSRAPAGEGPALAGEVEGYLKAQTYYAEACHEAELLRARLPWMTTAQTEEVTRHYVELRIGLTRQTLVRHIEDLREQYETRYRELRRNLLRRHAAVACAVLAASAGINAAAGVLWR
ncbi:hypothetical protein [Streptomyces sp. NPDC002788]